MVHEPDRSQAPARTPLAGKRMLFVAPDDYPAFRVDLTELFSRHLVSRGLLVDWSLHRVDHGPERIEQKAGERYFLPENLPGGFLRRLKNRTSSVALRYRLVWKTLRGEYDLVQVRDYTFWGLPFLIAARIAGKPFVYWMSYPVLDARWLLAVRPFRPVSTLGRIARFVHALAGKMVFYRVLGAADHVVVQSKRMRERMEDHGIRRERMTPLEMGVTTEKFNPELIDAADDPRLKGRKVVGYICSEFFGEPFDIALEALAHARAEGHDAVMAAVGQLADHERDGLPQKLAGLGLPQDSFVCTGRLPLPQALSYLKASDVCISPFQMNPEQEVATPTKLVEYLAMGRPVVASVHYDHNEVISASGAGLVSDFTGRAMGEALARILADPLWAKEMGARGPGWVKANRDYAHLAGVIERLYGSLVARRGKARNERLAEAVEPAE